MMELRQKGIHEEIIDEVLKDINSEEEIAYQAGKKRLNQVRHLDWQQFRQKLGGYLTRKGFNYETRGRQEDRC